MGPAGTGLQDEGTGPRIGSLCLYPYRARLCGMDRVAGQGGREGDEGRSRGGREAEANGGGCVIGALVKSSPAGARKGEVVVFAVSATVLYDA
jgi:hypothetical protein